MKRLLTAIIFVFAAVSTSILSIRAQDLGVPGEKHLANIKQLTFGGENAEAYFSFDGKQLIFQSKRDGHLCDRIYRMSIDGTDLRQVSNGEGRTTCSYFFKDGKLARRQKDRVCIKPSRRATGRYECVYRGLGGVRGRTCHRDH